MDFGLFLKRGGCVAFVHERPVNPDPEERADALQELLKDPVPGSGGKLTMERCISLHQGR